MTFPPRLFPQGVCLAAVAGLVLVTPAPAQTKLGKISGKVEAFQYASGLSGPDGMAFHPESGELYVAERDGNRISVIRNGNRETVIEAGFTMDPKIPSWVISKARTREFLTEARLQSPGSVAFGPNKELYVAERRQHGRLLEFTPNEAGQYTQAKVIPVPWIDKPFAWDDLKVAPDGRLFLVGYDEQGKAALHFGTVLMREATGGDWWVIDYGPFSLFSGCYLSRANDIVVITERSKGEIVAWDLERHLPIGTVPESVFQAEAEGGCLLRDGSYLVVEVPPVEKREGSKGQSRLIRVDPLTAQASGIAEGFDYINSAVLSPKNGYLYVSDAGAGIVAEVRPDNSILAREYVLQRSLETFEVKGGFTPRVAPAFINNFLARIGAPETAEQPKPSATERGETNPNVMIGSSFTLREFATKIPLVAGKVKTLLEDNIEEKNPVVEIDFLLFFPSSVIQSTDLATPSLSFFSARRKDGTIEQSRLLFGQAHATQRVGDQWLLQTDSASVYVPIATCAMERNEEGVDLNLAFLGMGVYDDFYLRLTTGKENHGSLMVEGKYGGSEAYKLSFVEAPEFGGEPVKNLVVAGFEASAPGEALGWLNIGSYPVSQSIALGDQDVARFAGMEEVISSEIEKKELERRIETGTAATEMDGTTPPAGAGGATTGGIAGSPVAGPAGGSAPAGSATP